LKSLVIYLIIFIAFGNALYGLEGDDNKNLNSSTAGFEYFPFNIGNTLVYDSNFGETKSNVTETENGFTITNESDDFKYVQSFIKTNDGIHITNTEHYLDVFLFISSENKIRYSEPALRIPFPLDSNSVWQWKGVEYNEDNDSSNITISGRYIGFEDLTTPAGQFECLRIELKVESEKGSSSVINEWLAPEIGLVKLHAELDGAGLIGVLQSILGFDEILFELKEII
jgi:hypothetical protein